MATKTPPVWGKIEQLRPDTHGHNLVVKVVDCKTVVDKPARGNLKPQRVAECTVGDETGTILLTARNEQVELMSPGSYVTLRNAKIDMYRGSMRLAVNQWGKVEAASGHSFEPKPDFNLSLVEFELVPVPQPEKPAAVAGDEEPPQESAPLAAEPGTAAEAEPAAEPEAAAPNGDADFEAAEAPPSS